jgi:hypothetical protein
MKFRHSVAVTSGPVERSLGSQPHCCASGNTPALKLILSRVGRTINVPAKVQRSDALERNPRGPMRLTYLLNLALQWIAALMLLAIVLIVLTNVFFRYFLHIGLGWTEEAARFLLIAMTFVAAAAAVKEGMGALPASRCHKVDT